MLGSRTPETRPQSEQSGESKVSVAGAIGQLCCLQQNMLKRDLNGIPLWPPQPWTNVPRFIFYFANSLFSSI